MEKSKINTGTYTFYKPQNLRGRPNNSIRTLLSKLKQIEKNEPKIFNTVFNEQGVCSTIDDLNLFCKLLIKEIDIKERQYESYMGCRFTKDDVSFMEKQMQKEIDDKKWDNKDRLNRFISKKINESIDDILNSESTHLESINSKEPIEIKNLSSSYSIKLYRENYDWIKNICESKSLTNSFVIRKCLELYRNKNTQKIDVKHRILYDYKTFFKPLQFSGTPNNKTLELLTRIKKLEQNNSVLVNDTIKKYGICRNYLDLLSFEHYILYLIRKEYEKIKDKSIFEPICLTKSRVPILLDFIFEVIEKEKNIIQIDEVIKPLRGCVYYKSIHPVRLSNVYNFYTSLIREINSKYNSENKVDKEEIVEAKEVKQKTEVNKECLNCGEKLKDKKPVKKFCNRDCYFEFRKKSSESSILISEEQIVEELQTEELDAQKSDFNPFEKPVTKRDYNLNNESTPSIENFNLHNKIDFLKDETILSIADYLNQKNECLYQKIENSIKKEFYFVESMFKIRADELKNIQSNIELKTNKLNSDLIVFKKSTKEIEKSINQIKILSFLNVIVLILIIFFLLMINK